MSDMHMGLEDTASLYKDKIINGWEKVYQKKRDRLYHLMKEYFVGESCLELGVADGEITEKLLVNFSEVHVVDGSSTFLNQVKKRVQKVHAHLSFFEDFKPNRRFSTIIATHILEHLDDPVLILKNSYNWLEDGGVIIISVPNAKSIHRLVGTKLGMLESPYSLNKQDKLLGHRRVYDKETLLDDISKTPFKVKHFTGLMLKPLSNRQIEKQWDDKLIDAFIEVGFDFPELCSEIVFILEK